MSRPEADSRRILSSLAAHAACAARSGLRLAERSRPPEPATRESLQDIRGELGDCRRCGLAAGRTSLVFGNGAAGARLVFVGEAPSPADDAEGRPFCGADGEMLANIITRVLRLSPADVYYAHLVKCTTPGGRPSAPDEVATCLPFLLRQLEAVGPDMVCALGEAPARALLASQAPFSELRGRVHAAAGFLIVPTHDPAYLLQNPEKKRETWDDMLLIEREMTRKAPPRN